MLSSRIWRNTISTGADKAILSPTGRPLIIAHRGASKVEHENTIEAFETALDMGADGIEFDVRRTKDGVYVAHHDESISGETLSEMTYAEADGAASRAGIHLPTLDEVLDKFGRRALLDIELKEQGYEGDIVPSIQSRTDAANIVITSFNDETISRAKPVWPEVRTGLVLGVDSPASVKTRISELFPQKRLRRCGADFVAPHFRLMKFGFVRRMQKAGYQIWVWTVDDTHLARSFADQGVAVIITNRPGEIRAALK